MPTPALFGIMSKYSPVLSNQWGLHNTVPVSHSLCNPIIPFPLRFSMAMAMEWHAAGGDMKGMTDEHQQYPWKTEGSDLQEWTKGTALITDLYRRPRQLSAASLRRKAS